MRRILPPARKMRPAIVPVTFAGVRTMARVTHRRRYIHVVLDGFDLYAVVDPAARLPGRLERADDDPSVAAHIGVRRIEALPIERLLPFLRALYAREGMSTEASRWVCEKTGVVSRNARPVILARHARHILGVA